MGTILIWKVDKFEYDKEDGTTNVSILVNSFLSSEDSRLVIEKCVEGNNKLFFYGWTEFLS